MFTSALSYSCTIQTVVWSKDSNGIDVKSISNLYVDVPCRIHQKNNQALLNKQAYEDFKQEFIIQVESKYNGAKRGDRVVYEGRNFVIAQKTEARGRYGTPNHINYSIIEQDDKTT